MNDISLLTKAIENYKVQLTENQLRQFQTYFEMLVERNKVVNLTAITEPDEVAVKHFADCISIFNYVDIGENATIIDVGTGAGFPGLVMKIVRPDIKLTLLDSLNKRLVFLDDVLAKLNLSAELLHSRAEDGAKDENYREKFDFAVSRAVAPLNILAEYCIPYVKLQGHFIAQKSNKANEEIEMAKSAVETLGGKVLEQHSFDLPFGGGNRTIVDIIKENSTSSKYPRKAKQIKNYPL